MHTEVSKKWAWIVINNVNLYSCVHVGVEKTDIYVSTEQSIHAEGGRLGLFGSLFSFVLLRRFLPLFTPFSSSEGISCASAALSGTWRCPLTFWNLYEQETEAENQAF
jgi:hypothetical protein